MLIGNKLPKKSKDEKVILFVRRHWFVLLYRMLFHLLLGLIPIFLYYFFQYFSPDVFEGELSMALIILGASAYYLFVWVFMYTAFIDHDLDVWIITNYRIVDIEQRRLFSRTWSEHNLDVVQDVKVEVKGIFPTFLGYGNITVQTAGPKIFFVFKQVPNPYKISKKIIKQVEDYKAKIKKTNKK